MYTFSIECLKESKSVYFVGIGGVSMSSLALICKSNGYIVAGSDRSQNETTRKLEEQGIVVFHSHEAKNIEDYDAVVYTAAIPVDNPEMVHAKELGKKIIYRAHLLGDIMKSSKYRIGVAGMHGKSTATAMVGYVFECSKRNPTIIDGACMTNFDSFYTIGNGNDFIFEACEYKDSFLDFYPNISLILNIELDHTDYFRDLDHVKESFDKFSKISENSNGTTIINLDNENSKYLIDGRNIVSFAIENKNATYYADNIHFDEGFPVFSIYSNNKVLLENIRLGVVGYHNIYNALAAFSCAKTLGLEVENIRKGLENFRGIKRRFEFVKTINGANVFLDYAHHPSELEATIKTAKKIAKNRVVSFFEPHTFSRTASFYNEFKEVLETSDLSYLLDVYAARETNIYGIDIKKMASEISNCTYIDSYNSAANKIKEIAEDGDVILILGAGTIDNVSKLI